MAAATKVDIDWTTSENFYLSTPNSAKHSIHKQLLEEKSKLIVSVASKEGRTNEYIFKDTSGTLIARFIKWAYSGDYTTNSNVNGNIQESNSPFMVHADLYIFAVTYMIEDLKHLARVKLTNSIRSVTTTPATPSAVEYRNRRDLILPTDPSSFAGLWKRRGGQDIPSIRKDAMAALIELMKFCFSGVLTDDDALLAWLAKFVAWSGAQFSAHPQFKAALPQVCRLVFPSMVQAPLAPWQCGTCAATMSDDCCFYCGQSAPTAQSRNVSQASTIGNEETKVFSSGQSESSDSSDGG